LGQLLNGLYSENPLKIADLDPKQVV